MTLSRRDMIRKSAALGLLSAFVPARAMAQGTIPLQQLGGCDDVAWLVAFLASPAGRYITGEVFAIDGGRQLWGDMWPLPKADPLPPVTLDNDPWEDDE